ncbi:MAG: hypothetical protein AAGG38_12310 [Planctomycetota bacterium]
MLRLLAVLIVPGILALSACSSRTFLPTYINIPPENGDWAFNNPNSKDVQQIQVVAIQKSLRHEPLDSPYELRLPENSRATTYALITRELGSDAVIPPEVPAVAFNEDGKPIPPDPDAPPLPQPERLGDFPTLEVRAIRIRAGDGQVDLVRPSTTGRRLSTVYLDYQPGFGWSADRVRAWRVDPDATPRPIGPAPKGVPAAVGN